jgi:hypothetical protein
MNRSDVGLKRIAPVLSMMGAVVVGVLAFPAAPAHADDVNKLTCLTFSGPIELPSVALPAGSYLFKHPDGAVDRHIVQAFSSDGKQVLGTFLTIPEERLEATDKTVVTFKETPVGVPEAVKAWFYPYEKSGDEFVYPREEAIKIAKATRQSVLSSSSPLKTAADMQKASVSRITATGETEAAAKVVPTGGMKSLKSSSGKSNVLAPCTGR